MSISSQIQPIVERFSSQIESYQQNSYNETQTRREFIDPFFIALGWDVANEQGYAQAYKDVVHEDALKIGRATKAPDYSFRIGGVRKFFLEAKKPSISLKDNSEAAFQVRRYGWSAKLPLSLLTNFAELAVYDCRIKPTNNDNAARGRILYLTYTDYLERWDDLMGWFSREAILTGAFDKYINSKTNHKGTATVDTAFLAEIERWRDNLARNIALRNPDLTSRELNFAVQQTIDRIIFLRICEDRGIEDYGRLLAVQKNGTDIYPRLFELFQQADQRYNSGLFHFQSEKQRDNPDTLTPTLVIDDKVLKDILKTLYYPDSPYEFSVLPADILGQVYEQFLGQVIRLTPAHRAVVEPKPEVKKSGGVYYTPTYIVNYIVQQTIGVLVEGKKPNQVSQLTILDPACGSGSFLLGAYQFLLDWHREHYRQNPNKWANGKTPRLYQTEGSDWQLTITERKRILLNNIYGVDIDSQAVEVTKLSLLLKVLENEQNLLKQLSLCKERVLPDLNKNIKCGNSLINNDFYNGQQLGLPNEETLYQINAFDWTTEFADVMKAGGFDAVIGNPPYVLITDTDEKKYLQSFYKHSTGKPELYRYFIERSHQLLKPKGQFGFIIPNTLLTIPASQKLREYLLTDGGLNQIVHFWGAVFSQVAVNSIMIFTKKGITNQYIEIIEDQNQIPSLTTLNEAIQQKRIIDKNLWLSNEGIKFSLSFTTEIAAIIEKLKIQSVELSSIAKYTLGMQIYHHTMHTQQQIKERIYHSDTQANDHFWPESTGRNVLRYHFKDTFKSYAAYGEWCYSKPAWEFCSEPRILIREITSRTLVAVTTDTIHIPSKAVIIIIPQTVHLHYLLGLLNSQLMGFYVRTTGEKGTQRLFPRISLTNLRQLPIRTIDFNNPTDKANHDNLVKLVEQMLALNKQLAAAKAPQTQTVLQRRIDATDKQIDELVYQLYGLTAAEIEIVENSG